MGARLLDLRPSRALPGLKRLPGVDVLRGLCVLAVVLLHINLRLHFEKSSLGSAIPKPLYRLIFWSGHDAVKIFFVVSGFLITSTILARWGTLPQIDLKAFYRLRAARIAPLLLAILAILSILHLSGATGFVINPKRASLPRALFAALTFHVNWLEPRVGYLPGAWDVMWSLSVEEVFYLAYPLLCRFCFRRKWIPFALLALLMIAGPLFRTVLAINDTDSDYAYLANMDGIALGCLAAVVARVRPRSGVQWLGAGLILAIRIAPLGLYRWGLDITVLEIGAALILLGMRVNSAPAVWAGPLRWFGRNSYEVYLTHMFVVTLGTQFFISSRAPIDSAWFWMAGMVLLAGLLGQAVSRYYSEPLNRRFRPAARTEVLSQRTALAQ